MNKSTQSDVIKEITPLSEKDCLYVAERIKSEFVYPIHNHNEFELNFIERASGVLRVVGDSTEIISAYDLVLITSKDLEHAWLQGECTSNNIREITIQFTSDFLSSTLLRKNQFESIQKMFNQAQLGVCFPLETIIKVYHLIESISKEKDGFYSVMNFYSLLYELSKSANARVLASSSYARAEVNAESRRVKKVQDYINNNYHETIRLKELSDLVGMTPVAFSKFFKIRTGINISEYIIKMRIGFATGQLLNTTNSISEICFECGFNNLSNFNRMFRKLKSYSPKEFRELYQKKRTII